MPEQFDQYAASYDQELAKSLSASGEGRDYFAAGRVAWLAKCLHKLEVTPQRVFDFGCGDGFTTPMLMKELGATSAVGADVSADSIVEANKKYAAPGASSFITSRSPSATTPSASCATRCAPEACSRCGRTTRGTRRRAT
jgi:ubiquinone/menaquinone biosynthesis C-methylase UbiE